MSGAPVRKGTLEADADFVTRFQREARVAASLNHANLVKVYASGEADGTHFIAMELIEGETLGDWLKRGPLPPLQALRICGDIARALGHGWQRAQLIHRDIKPGNVFLSIHGEVKVGDLGLAKTMGGDTTGLTQTGTAMGTPHYISPEQARGERDLDFRADIYSLGCTLYQMLTGQTPYSGGDPMSVMLQHINSPPPAIFKAWPLIARPARGAEASAARDLRGPELRRLLLQKGYLGALDSRIAAASTAGQLDVALGWRNELQRFRDGGQAVPAEDADLAAVASPFVAKTLPALRTQFRAQKGKLDADRLARAKVAFAKYDAMLSPNITLLTQRQRLDDALLLKTKRGEVQKAWLPTP